MEDTIQIQNLNLIVKDYIRTLELPKEKSKHPIVVLLVGIPASGKSYLAKNLALSLPLVLLSENDIQSFLVPKISFFERGQEQIFEFAKEVIKILVRKGLSCVFDTNLRTTKTRGVFRQAVENVKGKVVIIYLNCPKKAAYNRIKKRNLDIVTGESEGFVMDWDYFQYEINTTELPTRNEGAITFDSSKPGHQFEKVVSYLREKMY